MPETPGEQHASLALHLLLEGELGARKQTNRHITIVDRTKTTRTCLREAHRYQPVADPRGPGRDEMQAIVTHRRYSNRCELQNGCPCLRMVSAPWSACSIPAANSSNTRESPLWVCVLRWPHRQPLTRFCGRDPSQGGIS